MAENVEPTQPEFHVGPGVFYRRCSPLQIAFNFARFKPVDGFAEDRRPSTLEALKAGRTSPDS
jgi:hypothetical protein